MLGFDCPARRHTPDLTSSRFSGLFTSIIIIVLTSWRRPSTSHPRKKIIVFFGKFSKEIILECVVSVHSMVCQRIPADIMTEKNGYSQPQLQGKFFLAFENLMDSLCARN